MKDQVLSIEQMQKLKELGVDTSKASMAYQKNIGNNDYKQIIIANDDVRKLYDDSVYPSAMPSFTLQDIIELIRVLYKKKGNVICTEFSDESLVFNLYMFKLEWVIYDNYITGKYFKDENPLIAAYNILIWLAENKYI